MNKKTAIVICLLFAISFMPLVQGSELNRWEQWNDSDSTEVNTITEGELRSELGLESIEGYTPSSTFYCWCPYIISNDGTLQKGFWISNSKPKYCVWEYYDPTMHKFYREKKSVAVIHEGNFDGGRYAFADHNEFIIPALFLPERYGNWLVRSYFIFEDGSTGGEGPAVDESGNSYMIQFPVVHGSKFDLFFSAPIYIFGHKTIPLFFWLTPLWAFLIFILIMIIYTKSVVGAVTVIKEAVRATGEAKRKWRGK